jgi:ABC-2 type transport system ATP-binding protein
MSTPDLLVLDEPTLGLDPVAQREVQGYLRDAMKGRTTLLCTHNLAEAEALCDSAVIVREGRVLLHEPIERLRARVPPALALSATEGSGALIDALRAQGRTAGALNGNGEVSVAVDDPGRDAPIILRKLLDAGMSVFQCRLVTPTLEDLFLRVVEGREHDRGD